MNWPWASDSIVTSLLSRQENYSRQQYKSIEKQLVQGIKQQYKFQVLVLFINNHYSVTIVSLFVSNVHQAIRTLMENIEFLPLFYEGWHAYCLILNELSLDEFYFHLLFNYYSTNVSRWVEIILLTVFISYILNSSHFPLSSF